MMLLQRGGLLALAMMLAVPAIAGERAPSYPLKPGHPLKPGKAAGIVHAQQIKSGIALVAAGGVIAVVALVAGTGGSSSPKAQPESTPVTTGTP